MSIYDTDNKQLSMLEKLPLDVCKVMLSFANKKDLSSLRQCSKKLLNTTNEYLLSNPLEYRKAVTQLYQHRQNTSNITQAALERHSATKENGTLLLSYLTAEQRLQRILIGAKKGHLNDCDTRFVELCSYEEDLKLFTTEISLIFLKRNDPTLFNEHAKKIYPIFVAINNPIKYLYSDKELVCVKSILQMFFDNNIATPFSYLQSLINKIGPGSNMYDSSKNIIQFTITQISAEQKKTSLKVHLLKYQPC